MLLIIILTIWITCGFIHIAQESTKPYHDDTFWLLDFIFAPYCIITDIIHERKEKKKIEE
jgi:hypothetical protein